MPLDAQAEAILASIRQFRGPALTELDPAAARAFSAGRNFPAGPEAEVCDHEIAGPGGPLGIRTYRPNGTAAGAQIGGVVYFHGGGFVLGSVAGNDALCRQLAVSAGCLVASVEYRLAPEHRFPAAVEDAYAATCWVAEHAPRWGVDRAKLALAGESAGGNLAAVVAALARDGGGPPLIFQALLSPVMDLRTLDTPSYRDNAEGYLLTRAMMAWFRDHYLAGEAQRHDPRCSPLAAGDFAGLPATLVISAEYDPLRDEGAAYVRALTDAGVPARVSCYDGMIHTFTSLFPYLDRGRAALDEVSSNLRRIFAPIITEAT
jgi:acetyl esterase